MNPLVKRGLQWLLFIILFTIFVTSSILILENQFGFKVNPMIRMAPFLLLSYYFIFGGFRRLFSQKQGRGSRWTHYFCRFLVAYALAFATYALGRWVGIFERGESLMIFVLCAGYVGADILRYIIIKNRRDDN